MKKLFLSTFLLTASLICFSQTTIFSDNFDSYNAGDVISSQSSAWETWTGNTGNYDDALISNAQASSGVNSMHIINHNDIIYRFGDKVSGVYEVQFKMYITSGNGAYFNVEHHFASNYAFEMYFKENNQILFDNGKDSLDIGSYANDEWFTMKFLIDLNEDNLVIYNNDVSLGEYVFSLSLNDPPYRILGLIDFYGALSPDRGVSNSDYFIDDFQYIEITPANPLPGCETLNYKLENASVLQGTYNDLENNGSVISTGGNYDDANSEPVDIGFTFNYNCQEFTQFVLNTNGFIKLGDTPPSSAALFFKEANSFDEGILRSPDPADVNLISAFNHDLMGGALTPEYRVYTEGTSPDRITTIQFKNLKDKTTEPSQQYENIEFQIKLYETSNNIDFIYGDWIPSNNASAFKSSATGLKGSSIAHMNVLVATKASTKPWGDIRFYNGVDAGGLNFGNPPARPKPDNGLTLRFMPGEKVLPRVNEIYGMGRSSVVLNNPRIIGANIGNMGDEVLSDLKVKLDISGANSFTSQVTISSLNPQSNLNISFDSFIFENIGTNHLAVSIIDVDNNLIDQKIWIEKTTDYQMRNSSNESADIAYPVSPPSGSVFLTKYDINQSAYVHSVDAYISFSTTSIGQQVRAVVQDQFNTIIGQSEYFTIQPEDISTWHTFNLTEPVLVETGSFYAGIAGLFNGLIYYPIGSQTEIYVRPGTYNIIENLEDGSRTNNRNIFMIGANLSAVPQYLMKEERYICSGETYYWRGDEYTLEGVYYDSLISSTGIDSILVLDLRYHPNYEIELTEFICEGDIFEWRGDQYSTAGVYYDSLLTNQGCDFVYILDLQVGTPFESLVEASICQGESYAWRGQDFNESGTYYDSLLTDHGCDSVYILELTINTVNTAVTVDNNTITASLAGGSYQWVDCNNEYREISGETNQSFTPTESGNYAVVITRGECSDTSVCTESIIGATNSMIGHNVSIYPNPADDYIIIETGVSEPLTFRLINAQGKILIEKYFTGRKTLSVEHLESGIYFYFLKTKETPIHGKIIIQ